MSPEEQDLFYEPLISSYLSAPNFVQRDWLAREVAERLAKPNCRFVLMKGEPGAGKTGLIAALARAHPDWLRYFVRLDSVTPLSGSDATGLLLRIGHQLALLQPGLFDPELLTIDVEQTIGRAEAGSSVTGVRIEDLQVSPFYRTAIRVQQNVTTLAGGLTAIEVSRATMEPRLLESGALSHLALFDPALALKRKAPEARVTVLIDALDEVIGTASGVTILDWLERAEAPPENVRFVLSSRPHPRLRTLEGVRGGSMEVISIEPGSEPVLADVRKFAGGLFAATEVTGRRPEVTRETAVAALAKAARGNFAYLTAYARSLRAALASGSAAELDEVLEFESLPAGLPRLYANFARRMRRQIEALGQLEVASPSGPADEFTPAWEGVGMRFLGVLTVAFAPLTLKQLMRLGGVRVWESAASNVLQTLTPFLDETTSGWRLFHPSLAEFLRSAALQGAEDIAVDAKEWHERVLRFYKGRAEWTAVDWRAMDSYGLLHVADHLAASSEDQAVVCEIVTPGMRSALRERFLTDLPFRRILDTAQHAVGATKDVQRVLTDGIFLQLVRAGVNARARQLDPAVYGLMARLGRVEEALARAQVMEPGLRKYRTVEAICRCAAAEQRRALGPLDGVELLVGTALEVPPSATRIVGFPGFDLASCLTDAAADLAPYDLERALGLAEMADKYGRAEKASDVVLSVAVSRAPENVLGLLGRMQSKRLSAAVEAAERTESRELRKKLLAFALDRLEDEEPRQRWHWMARAFFLAAKEKPDGLADIARELRSAMEALLSENSESRGYWGVVSAAELLREVDAEFAKKVLCSVDGAEVEVLVASELVRCARVWASWGEADEARKRLNLALPVFRGLGWYGPARDLAQAAGVAATFDAEWARELDEEAIHLIEPVVQSGDEFEWSRLSGVLSGMFEEYRERDRKQALCIARWMRGGWIHGGPWMSSDGRGSALALLGLDVADEDTKGAQALLVECLGNEDATTRLGRPDARQTRHGLYVPVEDLSGGTAKNVNRVANATTYITNSVQYWMNGREWRFFDSPAAVLRSLEEVFPEGASWARVVAAAVRPLADIDVERAMEVAYWPADPAERIIAVAAMTGGLDPSDVRFPFLFGELSALLKELPEYAPQVDMDRIPQGPVLRLLNPAIRARFEASLLTAAESGPYDLMAADDQGLWYVSMISHAERLLEALLEGKYSEMAADELEQQLDEIGKFYAQRDDLVRDLLESAGIADLARRDGERAAKRLRHIESEPIRAVARLYVLASQGKAVSARNALNVLQDVSDSVSPLQRAGLGALAITVLQRSAADTSEVMNWARQQLQGADPLMVTRGLGSLASVAEGGPPVRMLSEALQASEHVKNEYVRNDAVSDLLGQAVAAGDAGLVQRVLEAVFASGWNVFTDALRRAVPEIVRAGGADILERMDAAMRRAQTALGSSKSDAGEAHHFDAVLSPALRKDAYAAAMREADRTFRKYASTYLEDDDIGTLLQRVLDSRSKLPDEDDDAFVRLRGLRTGLCVWMGEVKSSMWHLEDVRFLFRTVEEAAAYHAERLLANAEGSDEVGGARAVGEETRLFRGTRQISLDGLTVEMTAFSYLFRVGRMVVKLFVEQGPDSSDELQAEQLVPLAERIVEKVKLAEL